MKSITIHKLDDEIEARLVELAEREGQSLNQTVKQLLREKLGAGDAAPDHRADFEEFCGAWTAKDKREFDRAVAPFSEIDPEIWK